MQAALQVGAATSRPSSPYACGKALCSMVFASAVADIVSVSSDAASMYLIFMVRLLDDGREATAGIEVACIDCAWPTHRVRTASQNACARLRRLVRPCARFE